MSLACRDLATGHRDRVLLTGFSAELQPGMLTALVGCNGAGKTTLLRTLAGLLPPRSGEVLLDGVPVGKLPARQRARRIAVGLTGDPAVPHATVFEILAASRFAHTGWYGTLREGDREAIIGALEKAGAAEFGSRRISELSDGERQRVRLARVLAQQSPWILLDEPTAFLDVAHRVETVDRLRETARTCGGGVLFSTHELDLAVRFADSIWLLHRDGRAIAASPSTLLANGELARAFEVPGVRFNSSSLRFEVEP